MKNKDVTKDTLYKKIINEVSNVVKHELSKFFDDQLNEMDYRTAALAHGANYDAIMDLLQTGNANAESKIDASNQTRIKALSLAIHDNFDKLSLNFIETDKANQHYTVVLNYTDVKLINKERFILAGNIKVSGKADNSGFIEFNFKTQKFYRVKFYANGTIRRIYELCINPRHKNIFIKLLSFVSKFLYSEEDYETNVNTNGSHKSKRH